MKNQEQLDARVPRSAGMTTDNPIFVTNRDTVAMSDNEATEEEGDVVLEDVPAGVELRIYGCKQVGVASPYHMDGRVVSIPNRAMDHVEGRLGTQSGEIVEYTEVPA